MPSPNNLRIISQNWADLATITASSTGGSTSPDNLKSDTKSLVWRSTTGTQASLILDFGVTRNIGGVALAFTNLPSSSATIRVVGYNTAPSFTGSALNVTGAAYNSGLVTCCPWNNLALPSWGTNPAGSSNYSYGGGTHARVWLSSANAATAVRYLGIEIADSTNTAGFIEVSRVIAGNFWSPTYNTGYGMQAGIKDLSEHVRTEGGDLLTRRGPRFRTLNFDLQWVTPSDRKELTRIFLGNGMPRPLFVSLFPDSTGVDEDFQREGIHQIYGKMVQVPGVSYTSFEVYSTNIELEEV
jgi:hypothetical protein